MPHAPEITRILPCWPVDVTSAGPYSNLMKRDTIWTPPAGTSGLIFDCDGTLADTMPAHYKAWTAMLGRHGIPFPEPRFYAMGGMPTAQIIRVLAGEVGVAVTDVDAMVFEKEEQMTTFSPPSKARSTRGRTPAKPRSP